MTNFSGGKLPRTVHCACGGASPGRAEGGGVPPPHPMTPPIVTHAAPPPSRFVIDLIFLSLSGNSGEDKTKAPPPRQWGFLLFSSPSRSNSGMRPPEGIFTVAAF